MKYLISESKLQKVALDWMNKNFYPDDLEVFTSEYRPNSVFFKKDGEIIMEYDLRNKMFWFHYDKIWLVFEKFFNMKYKEVENLLKVWLRETFKLYDYTPWSRTKYYPTEL